MARTQYIVKDSVDAPLMVYDNEALAIVYKVTLVAATVETIIDTP